MKSQLKNKPQLNSGAPDLSQLNHCQNIQALEQLWIGHSSRNSFNVNSFNVISFNLISFNLNSFNVISLNVNSFKVISFNVILFNVSPASAVNYKSDISNLST